MAMMALAWDYWCIGTVSLHVTVLIAIDAPPSFLCFIAHADAQLSFVATTVQESEFLNIFSFSVRQLAQEMIYASLSVSINCIICHRSTISINVFSSSLIA